eukprot:3647994-Prymnesium_polylepis.1
MREWCSGLYATAMADWLFTWRRVGSASLKPRSLSRLRSEMASFAASEAATISASHDESAIVACFFELHDIAADM